MVAPSIGSAAQETIERLTAELRERSPMLSIANAGRFSARALGLYLESLRYLFQQSQLNLQLASQVTRLRGDPRLAEHFAHKAVEERGHDAWALNDLSQLAAAVTQGLHPLPSVVRLVELQRTLLSRHPLLFFVYALWAEYFTVLVGDEWIDALKHSGYAPGQLSAVGNHVSADRDHAREGFHVLDALWRGEPSREELCAAIAEAAKTFEGFCDEVCAEALR
jgi:hypothetical protein